MSLWATLEADAQKAEQILEADVKIIWSDVEAFVEYLVGQEINTWKTQILPLFQQAAINLQNETPGLTAKNFIPALVAAVLPILPEALKDMEYTLLSAIASAIAKFFNVSNSGGNAGNLPAGEQVAIN